jgi:asparagine N-glycosylation enzyme membrane subunit Stt3
MQAQNAADFLKSFLKKRWSLIAIVLIILLSVHIRLLDYRWPYLRNIDSYVYYRQMDMIIANNGALPDHDPYVLAPDGNAITTNTFAGNFYVYLGAYSYMFFHTFMQDMLLWQFLVWFPPLLASLMAIPMYYIGKMLYDRRAGVLAAFFVVFDISIMVRSLGGDPDNDAIVLLMPLILIAVYLYACKKIESGKLSFKTLGLHTALFGALLFLWANTWGGGYWYVIWLLGGFVLLRIIVDTAFRRSAPGRRRLFISHIVGSVLILFLLSAAVGSYGVAAATVQGPFSFAEIKDEGGREFPNVYVSVAELQSPGDIRQIIQRITPVDIGTNPAAILISPFFLMIYSLVYLAYSYLRKRQHFDTLLLLLIWFMGPLLSTTIGIRFSILFSAPMALGSAILLSKITRMATSGENLED